MKKTITAIAILTFTLLLSTANSNGLVGTVYAWDDCPKGLVNDKYPGSCPQYVDTDKNGICDRSEPAPKDRIDSQDQNNEIAEKQTKNTLNTNIVSFLAILIPLTALVGYAIVYKIKQQRT
jgi:hypothetical protein